MGPCSVFYTTPFDIKGQFRFIATSWICIVDVVRDNFVLTKVIAELWEHRNNATTKSNKAKTHIWSDDQMGHKHIV